MPNDIEMYGDNQDVYLTAGDKFIFNEVDEIMDRAVAQGDPSVAMKYGRALRKDVRVRGVALAKLLWRVSDNWYLFEKAGIDDDVYDVIDSEMGVPPATSSKYIHMWETIFANPEIPDNIKEALLCKPVRTLILLPSLSTEGEDVDWNEIAQAKDHEEVRQIIKRIRGEATSSKTALFIKLDVRTGQLAAKRGDTPFVNFGLLNLNIDNEVVKSAIERIIRDARIMEV